jgi:hypothetical protein
MRRKALLIAAALLSALYIGAVPFRTSTFYAGAITPHVLQTIASVCKLLSLGAGVVFASRSRLSFDEGSLVRSAWTLMRAWFACFFLGQLVLTTYELRTGSAPVPSIGDPFFILGYAAVTIATIRFIVGYRASGFAVGATRGHVIIAVVVALLSLGAGFVILSPVAHGAIPLPTKLMNLAYPVLDFILLVPTLVLLRMAYAFRGGRVWSVWATLLVGVVFFTAGDILFAIQSPLITLLGPLSDLCFLLGYGFAAAGAGRQSALLDD